MNIHLVQNYARQINNGSIKMEYLKMKEGVFVFLQFSTESEISRNEFIQKENILTRIQNC